MHGPFGENGRFSIEARKRLPLWSVLPLALPFLRSTAEFLNGEPRGSLERDRIRVHWRIRGKCHDDPRELLLDGSRQQPKPRAISAKDIRHGSRGVAAANAEKHLRDAGC